MTSGEERNSYIKERNVASGTIKDIIKIRLHICGSTTEHVLECNKCKRNKGDKKFNLNDERGREWGEIVEIYRKNKKNRSKDNIHI